VIDRELIISKANRIHHHLQQIRRKRGADLAEFLASEDRQQLVAFNIQLAVQNCTDIAAHIIAGQGWGVSGSINEMFYTLEEKGCLSHETTEKMVAAVGFRNLVVHEYGKIDNKRLFEIASKDIDDLTAFLREIFKHFQI